MPGLYDSTGQRALSPAQPRVSSAARGSPARIWLEYWQKGSSAQHLKSDIGPMQSQEDGHFFLVVLPFRYPQFLQVLFLGSGPACNFRSLRLAVAYDRASGGFLASSDCGCKKPL